MKKIFLIFLLLVLLSLITYPIISCDDDDDDFDPFSDDFGTVDDGDDDEDDDECINCSTTAECLASMGDGYACVDKCCKFIGVDDDDTDSNDCDYVQEYKWLYNDCGVTLLDEAGDDLSLDEAIDICNECIGDCAYAYRGDSDCDSAITCIIELCFK